MSAGHTMSSRSNRAGGATMTIILDGRSAIARLALGAALLLWAACFGAVVHAAGTQRTFATAEEAAEALVRAAKANDKAATAAILGPGSADFVASGDAVADRAAKEGFVAAYKRKHAIVPDGDARATLALGDDGWPFAFPLVKADGRWRFDTQAGKDEMLARRIGRNELDAINVMLAIVDAQRDYASADRNRDGVLEYAGRFASTAGKRDGLYWPTKAGEEPSPLGPLVMQAAGEGYAKEKQKGPRPYHGYYFRLLKAQGPGAPGGAIDYVVRGRMIGGFAAIAYPAKYGSSGIMTFIVSHDGTVYEKDLGPQTATAARAITRFDPGAGWAPVPLK